MKSQHICSFVCLTFSLSMMSSVPVRVSEFHSFLKLNNTPSCMMCLSIHALMDIWVVSLPVSLNFFHDLVLLI